MLTAKELRRRQIKERDQILTGIGRSAGDIANRLNQHIEAGADHVAIRVLGGQDKSLSTLVALSDHLNTVVDRLTLTAVATWVH